MIQNLIEPVKTSLNNFRQVWTILGKFEQSQTTLDSLILVWTISDYSSLSYVLLYNQKSKV